MTITCGIDWAEAHHDVAVMDGDGRVLGRRKIDTGVTGFGELMSLLVEHCDDPTTVPVAIETDKNRIVVALQAAGLTVFPINPRAVAAIESATGSRARSPIRAMRPCLPTFFAPIDISTARFRRLQTAAWR